MDLSEIAAYKRLHQTVVEASQDRETFKQATIYLFNNLIANQGYGNGVYEQKSGDKELSRYEIACHHLNGNIDMIYDYTESPIEKLFLCSLLTVSMRFSPFMIAITAPVVADVFPTKISTFHERNREIKQAFRKEESLAQIANMLELIEELEPAAYSILPKHLDAMGRGLTNNLGYLLNGLGLSFHVSLQPTFEKLRIEGKSIRPDMIFWVPMRPDFKLIVECDGYEFHSNKEAFSKDRIRDRVLQQEGYQVFRFSGHEIVQNATLKVNEFIDYLSDLADKFDLDLEQAQGEMNTFKTDLDFKREENSANPQSRAKKKKKPSPQQRKQQRHARRHRR